jgi:hypothetical protein
MHPEKDGLVFSSIKLVLKLMRTDLAESPFLKGLEVAPSFDELPLEKNGFLCPSGIKPGFSSPFQGRGQVKVIKPKGVAKCWRLKISLWMTGSI